MINKISNVLMQKPLKKLPQRLIMDLGENHNLISLKSKKVLGHVKTYPEYLSTRDYYSNARSKDSFYIEELEAYNRRQGIGTILVNHVKRLSKQNPETAGRVHLDAINYLDNSTTAPGAFFWKLGFKTQNKLLNKLYKTTANAGETLPAYHNELRTKMYLGKSGQAQ